MVQLFRNRYTRILEEMKDIVSLDRNRFLETCWHRLSYRRNRVYLESVSCLRIDIQDHPVDVFLLKYPLPEIKFF